MKTKSYVFISLLLLVIAVKMSAQVTIGSIAEPNKGSLLDLKEFDPLPDNANSTKGVLLPRVKLNSSSNFNDIISGASSDDMLLHAGLTVFNVGSPDVCRGLYVWNKEKWDNLTDFCQVSIDCGSVAINGVYKVGNVLVSSNTMTLTIIATKDAIGGTYHIYTNTVNGISFSATGTILSGNQTITLIGSGTPQSGGKAFDYTIRADFSNSPSPIVPCTVTMGSDIIPIAKATIFGFGAASGTYGYFLESSASKAMVSDLSLFGPNSSYVKCDNYAITSLLIDALTPTAFLQTSQWKANPDILVNGYYSHTTSTVVIDSLVSYLNRGGVLFLFDEYGSGGSAYNITFQLCKKLFPGSTITQAVGATSGSTSTVKASIDDEITNGIFGDVRGKGWGHDASSSMMLKGLPADSIIAYSDGSYRNLSGTVAGDASAVAMFRHKRLNLFFCGDGGFLSNPNNAVGSLPYPNAFYCPFALDANHLPVGRTGWGYGTSVYNSTIFANLMAWAVKRTQSNNRR